MIRGHPALRLLARRKILGMWRKLTRRMRSVSGAAFVLLGAALVVGWLSFVLIAYSQFDLRERVDEARVVLETEGGAELPLEEQREPMIKVIALVLSAIAVFGALNHRGLYMPKDEIELLLSIPVARSDLIRYRLFATMGRACFSAFFFGLIVMSNMPRPLFGFLGAALSMFTLPLVGQGASLLAGDAENRLSGIVAKVPTRALSSVLALVLVAFIILMMQSAPLAERLFGEGGLARVLTHPVVAAVSAPFHPWAQMVTAESLAEFAPWFALCILIWLVLFESIARIPIDFRELSLQTSADVAKRLQRARRAGLGASSSMVPKRAIGWRAPWIFGRGPFGAIAWRKTTAILRKSRGTLMTAGLILSFLTVISSIVVQPDSAGSWDVEMVSAVFGSLIIAVFGQLYLCAGLRFDFREDLERMESIKSWPLRPACLFLAMLLPEVVLVSVLLCLAIVARIAITGDFTPLVLAVMAPIPLFVMGWVTIDNIVFLYAPVRYVPGQDGLLHNAGRSLVLMFVRSLVSLVTLVLVAAPSVGAFFLCRGRGLGDGAALAAAVVTAGAVLVLVLAALTAIGGAMLKRFDVARDRG